MVSLSPLLVCEQAVTSLDFAMRPCCLTPPASVLQDLVYNTADFVYAGALMLDHASPAASAQLVQCKVEHINRSSQLRGQLGVPLLHSAARQRVRASCECVAHV